MQPAEPDPWMVVNMVFFKMARAAGAKEVELGVRSERSDQLERNKATESMGVTQGAMT